MSGGGQRLEARLWGEPSFWHRGQEVVPVSRKAVALLAYLVVVGGPVARDELAALLWGRGRLANLRQALYTLRSLPGAAEWLRDGVERLSVNASSDACVAADAAPGSEAELLARLPAAAEFLEGLDDGLPPAYQEWLAGERARQAGLAVAALEAAAAALEGRGKPREARRMIERAQAFEPYEERLQRSAMRLAYLAGDHVGALAGYAAFARRLESELGSLPAPETSELAGRIERLEPVAPQVSLAALTDDDMRVLQGLALARGALKLDGLARVLERPAFDLAADLARLAELGLVSEALELAPEQRRAALAALPGPLARLLHERIAGVMRDDPDADHGQLARHLLAAGERSEAARRALAGATAATGRGRSGEATDLLYLTLWAAQEEPAVRVEACLLLESTAAMQAHQEAQEDYLAEARRLAWELQSDAALTEVNIRRARLLLGRSRVGEALEEALTALQTALRMGHDGLVARARNTIGAAHFYAGDLDGAALAFESNLTSDDEVERYRAQNNLGSIDAMRGRHEHAYRHFDAALTLARRNSNHLDVSATLNNLAASAERMGDYPRAERHFKEATSLARRSGAARREAEMLVNLAVCYARQGQLGPAWNTTAEVEALAAELSDGRLAMRVKEQRGEILRVCGDLDGAVAVLDYASAAAAELGDERKRLSLVAQALAVRSRLDPTLTEDAARAIGELEDAGLTDVPQWLRLELASWTLDLEFGRSQLMRLAADGLKSSHQRSVRDLVAMRFGLLAGADAATLAAAAEARARLVTSGVLPQTQGGAPTQPPVKIVERPKARYLALAFDAAVAGQSGLPAVPDAVLAELAEQGAGLPRSLAAALLTTPRRWLPG